MHQIPFHQKKLHYIRYLHYNSAICTIAALLDQQIQNQQKSTRSQNKRGYQKLNQNPLYNIFKERTVQQPPTKAKLMRIKNERKEEEEEEEKD